MKREREETLDLLWDDYPNFTREVAVSLIRTEQLRYGQRIAEELVKRTMVKNQFIQELLMELLDED